MLALLSATPLAAQDRPARSETAAGAESSPRTTARATTAVATGDTDEPGRGDATNTQPAGDPRAARAREAKLGDSDVATAPIQEVKAVTHHVATINGRTIPYSAIAGTVTIRDDDGKPTASMFYVAYVADHGPGESPAR